MKSKRIMKILVAIVLIICSAMISSIVKAAELNPSLYFGITELREKTGMGYSIWDPDSNGETGIAAKIWNIVQYSGPNTNDPTEANVYCVKAGVGFTEGQGTKEVQEYNLQFDMYTERDAIANQDANTSKVLYNLVNGGHYNELLAIANLIYIPGESTEAEKETLLRESGVLALQEQEYAGLGDEYKITDDEIEAVQQAAIWYFTNYGEENGKYDVYDEDAWLWYTENGTDYKALSSYGTDKIPAVGVVRREQALALYRYLVDEAKEQAGNYATETGIHRHKLTLYTTAGGNSQPLMKVERLPQFDLALRKYITEVNGVAVTNSRVPAIDESTLEDGTTATYNHRKDPVMVENGDIVTYNITIYNEGEVDGRATKIIDQLPTGLKYSQIVTQGFTAEYDEANNTVTITREAGNETNLTAYQQGQLDSETIEIECVVDTTQHGKVLTNVAWIAEEVDENGNVIIDEVGEDRDSEPGTAPNVNKDNMENYKGNTANKDDLTDQNYFYKGEQDDDDFEKLIVRHITGNYQIQLEKVDEKGDVILEGAEFGWTLPGQSEQTGTTTNGILNLGTVEITDVSTTDTITIREITAPDGYNKLIGSLTVEVTKGEQNDSYVATGAQITAGQVEGAEVELNGNVITITVPNVPVEGNYQLQLEKVDENGNIITSSETEFGWTLPGQSEQTGTTVNGILNLGMVEIADISTPDTITIREITAPNGYIKLIDSITVQVTKGENNGNYVVTGAEMTAGQVEGATVELNGNVITITVPNKLLKGNYQVQLEKVDENGNIITSSEAEFGWTLPGQGEQTGTTTNGMLNLGTVQITDVSTTDTITITEITPPSGYNKLIDNITVEVTKGEDNGTYVATGAQITAGQVEGAEVELNGNVITITVPNVPVEGNYQLQLEKVDENGNIITSSETEFGWTLPGQNEQTGTTTNGILDLGTVEITDVSSTDTITIREITAPDGYKKLIDSITVQVTKGENNGSYVATGAQITAGQIQGVNVRLENNVIIITVPNEKQNFDLALRKFISEVDGTQYDREPNVDLSGLEQGTTAIYNHTKQPILVKRNSVIIYTIRVYNEGEIDGYAEQVTDYLPQELEFLPEHEINIQYEWQVSEDGRIVTTDYLSSAKETEDRQNMIKAFDGQTLDYKELQIACKVKEDAGTNVKLTNLAEITEDSDEDRDSTPDNIEIPGDEELPNYKDDEIDQDYVPGQEDDDDFEKVIIQDFDLALRKFITKVDDEEVTTRIPEISYDREENQITYNHTKEPVEVITGNIVEYTIRIYNEGDIAGYAQEVADDIPDGLNFLPENETNIEYRWVMYDEEGNETENVEEAVEIRTDYLSKEQEETEGENLLEAFNPEEEIGEGNPDYRDIKVAFEVVEPNESDRIIVNSAQITEDSDEDGNPIDDIDSIPDEWNEGEDDQDREYIKLTYFDLALRKWVTEAIVIENGQETITQTGHTAEMDPEPVVKVELYRKNLNDVVVKFRYSIRITNEGDIAGYATEITDYVPEGLRFVAEDNPGWTDEGNNVISTRLLENTLLQPGESAEVEVVLTWINGEDNMGQMTNIAEISEHYNDKGAPDRDSTPDNQVWGEDDIDDAPVLLSIETGQERIYYILGFTVLGTLAGGLILIKKFVI